jgi:hypothetical protein
MLRSVQATRYVTPLREGGSLPAIVEADDLGLYVLKFYGAGQGPLALAAEIIAGEIGRLLGLPVPELVLVQVDEALGRNERDEEVRDLLCASVGLNLGIDYLSGSMMFDPAAGDVADAEFASQLVWFDAFVTNVDCTARSPNLLCWHKKLYPIDHGAALYFHYNWQNIDAAAESPFGPIRDHVLLRWAARLEAAQAPLPRKPICRRSVTICGRLKKSARERKTLDRSPASHNANVFTGWYRRAAPLFRCRRFTAVYVRTWS